MRGFQIKNICTENWNEMTPNEKGAFCSKCSKSVHNFAKKSLDEIKIELIKSIDKNTCGRIQNSQAEKLNQAFHVWQMSNKKTMNRAMLFSLIIVFGLSIVSCSNEKDEQLIQNFQTQAIEVLIHENKEVLNEKPISQDSRSLNNFPIYSEGKTEDSVIQDVKKDTSTVQFVEIECFADVGYYTMGMLSVSTEYQEFLEDTVPEIVDEYDRNGILLPHDFSALLFPNPTISDFKIDLKVAERNIITIQLFSQQGEIIESIKNEEFERGSYSIPVSLTNLPSGVYLVVIHSNKYNKTLRIVKQ